MNKFIISFLIITTLFATSCTTNNSNEITQTKEATASVENIIPSEEPEPSEPISETTPEPSTVAIEKPVIDIVTLSGPTGISMAKLMEEDELSTLDIDYNFTILTNPQEAVAMINTGEADIASVPTNLAANLFNKTEGYIDFIGINTLGVLYILENGKEISSISDLTGKTIYATGQGAVPEYVLEYILEQNGLIIGQDVFVEYLSEHAELATQLASNNVNIAMLPEPFVTSAMSNNPNLKIALSITEEWEKLGNGVLPMGGVITTSTFTEVSPELIEGFIEDYKNSVSFTNSNVEEASKFAAKFEILPNEQIGISAIPKSNITWIYDDSKISIMHNFYEILFNKNPDSLGGFIPGEDFYY